MTQGPERRWLAPRAPGASDPPHYDSPAYQAESDDSPSVDPGGVDAPPSGEPVAGAPPPSYSFQQLAAVPGGTANGTALASLLTGIAGLVLFVLSGFGMIFILNLPPSIIAWVLGVRAKQKVDRGETDSRREMAQVGMVLGIIGTVIGVLALIAWIIAIVSSQELQDEMRKQFNDAYNRK